MTLGFNDAQLQRITNAAAPLPIEKRSVFLSRVMAHLEARGVYRHAHDGDIESAVRAALVGLIQAPATSACWVNEKRPQLAGTSAEQAEGRGLHPRSG